MADEKVNIKIVVDVKDRDLSQTIAKMGALKAAGLASGRSLQELASGGGRSAGMLATRWTKAMDSIDTAAKMTGKMMTKFLTLAIKGVIIEMALLSAALVGVNLLFAAGRLAIKAYNGAMQVLAGGAAIAGTAIAAVSAAIREQQAAMFAYRGKGAAQFGSAMQQTRMAMRNLQADASLASLGVENLNKAYGVMSKTMNVSQINASGKTIKALMDFGSAGQDPAQGLEAVANVVAALSDSKKNVTDVLAAAQKLGPEMQKALKDAKVKTKDQFRDLLFSGKLAEMGGVTGQFDAVNNTLINVMKGYFGQIRTLFADVGDQFLEPLKIAFQKIFWSIQDGIYKMVAVIEYNLGFQGIMDGTVSMVDRITDFMVKMMREYLPRAIGMFERIANFWNKFVFNWNQFFDKLRPLEEGARTIYKALKPVWEGIKEGAKQLYQWNDLLKGNEATAIETGERIRDIIVAIADLYTGLKQIFTEAAPFINDVLKGLTDIFKLVSKVLTLGAGKGFGAALAPLLAFSTVGRALGGVAGRMVPTSGGSLLPTRMPTMSVSAGVVHVTGPVGPGSAATGTIVGGIPSGLASGAIPGIPRVGGGGGGGGGGLSSGLVAGVPTSFDPGSMYGLEALASTALGFKDMKKIVGTDPLAFIKAGARIQAEPARGSFERRRAGRKGARTRRSNIMERNRTLFEERMAASSEFNLRRHMGIDLGPEDDALLAADPGLRDFYDPRTGKIKQSQIKMTYAARQRQLVMGNVRTSMRGAADQLQYRARQGIGAVRGFGKYLSGAAFDPATGTYTDPETSLAFARGYYSDEGVVDPSDPTKRMKYAGSKFMRGIRRFRTETTIKQRETRFGRGYSKFGQSAFGKMGASAGLGLASQMAPEEMRGAMALGATVSQIDPRLGMAVAGIGGAFTAKSAGAGALSGAMGGAAIGGQFGPYGVLIGGAIGALVGGISGAIRSGQEKLKQARLAAENGLKTLYDSIARSASQRLMANVDIVERGGRVSGAGALSGFAQKQIGARQKLRSKIQERMMIESAKYTSNDVFGAGTGSTKDAEGVNDRSQMMHDVITHMFKNQAAYGIELSQADYDNMITRDERMQEYLGGLGYATTSGTLTMTRAQMAEGKQTQKQANEDKIARAIGTQEQTRLKELSAITGKSGAELEVLAKQMGVNLYDPTKKFTDLVAELGVAMKKSAGELNDALADVLMDAGNYYRKLREAREASARADTSSQALADTLRSGGLGGEERTTAIQGYAETIFGDTLAAAGGDATKAFLTLLANFGSGATGGAFAEGEVFAGMGQEMLPVLQPGMKIMQEGYASSRAGQISGALFEAGLTGNMDQIQRQIMGMTPEQIKAFEKSALVQGGMSFENMTQEQMTQYLAKYGLGGIATQVSDKEALDSFANMDEAAKNLGLSVDELKKAAQTMNDSISKYFVEYTDKNPLPVRVIEADTATPRGDTTSSRLAQTMSRHAMFDGSLTGNRTVTSSYRTYGLGSINSDHVTGKAYDLTGQNLGQYARLVHANGGFAEFHGTMADRHLHVVPGMGDTAMPSMTTPMTTGGGGGGKTVTNYYNVEINGANQSPEQIANMVMAKIDERERSMSERM